MTRDYGNNITHSPITGFQSPAAEYAQKRLSIDEKYDTFNPEMQFITLEQDHYLFGLKKGDLLQIRRDLNPKHNDLIYTSFAGENGIFRFLRHDKVGSLYPPKYNRDQLDDVISGVIVAIHRSMVEAGE